jgi:hypothetical protein
MSSGSTGKFQTAGMAPGDLYRAFVKAVGSPPSPRAQALIEAREWDVKEEAEEGKLKTGGLEPRATALAGRPLCYYPWYQPGTVGLLWLDLGPY